MGNRITDGDFRDGTLGEWKAISGNPKVIVFPGTQEYVLFSGVNPPQPADDHPPVYMEVARTGKTEVKN